ncbi:DNA polymerase III subunit gamma/tau [Halomonas sp. PAMB 3264]|uniref:DNA polymerase III subunit gamma/tau n=1 Tax=Halomonas sp. PAMB 3264 TaxID=3075222 RepID=UPI00289BD32E|nr:DNA polymerase III subunit gamma/tau [Halomonas sp. PAMB 3264]WNL41155.1 DNA polymerase III subunit gamma/tau [Halomonas sp. PAMB 3264]
MSYQVLARKWRPRTFHELVGQTHVQRALVNALDQGRLHHAYLFTGTRGVGKTTLARILAKCLNCTANGEGDDGVTSTPCGQCDSCRAIDEGRFVDLIEVDAASRTKVEDTRELLDNVQYAPTQGRYKVYLIDEVHMLSTSSFNALLKTLEEPPPHVKFLLATTDPQKLPPTVLSRCLQFTLKHMPPERVVEHLTFVLGQEGVAFDESALWLLGKAAEGSMRDAMSLTDQAIAFGQGAVRHADVAAMLGTLDHRHILALAKALAEVDVQAILAEVATLSEQGPDFAAVLDDLTGILHRLAVAQMVPGAVDNSHGDRDTILELAGHFTAEDIQLYYQIGIQGRGDMEHAPDLRSALEMTLLRMLAFRPQGVPRPPKTPLPLRSEPMAQANAATPADHEPAADAPKKPDPAPAAFESAPVSAPVQEVASPIDQSPPPWAMDDTAAHAEAPEPEPEPEPEPAAPAFVPDTPIVVDADVTDFDEQDVPVQDMPVEDVPVEDVPVQDLSSESAFIESAPAPDAPAESAQAQGRQVQEPADEQASSDAAAAKTAPVPGGRLDHAGWLALFDQLGLGGLTRNLAAHCQLASDDGRTLVLTLDPSQSAMQADVHQQRLEKALADQGFSRSVSFEVGELDTRLETPRDQSLRFQRERHASAVDLLQRDPNIQKLRQAFGATLNEESVKPKTSTSP